MEIITWPGHGPNSFKRIKEFYCNQALCDVSLIALDGTTFKAHQLLLAIHSSFFHRVFHGWRETNERVREFKTDIESHVLDALLSLIYQGEVKIPSSWVWRRKILEAANTFQLPGITEALKVTADMGASYQREQQNIETGFPTEQKNLAFQTEQQNPQTGFQRSHQNSRRGFQNEQRNTGAEFETEQQNQGTVFQTRQQNTGDVFQTEHQNIRTGFQIEQQNRGAEFQIQQQNIGTSFQTKQQDRKTEFQTKQQNRKTEFQTKQQKTGFQIDPKDKNFVHNVLPENGIVLKNTKTGLQMGSIQHHVPVDSMPYCQLSRRSEEFLFGTQQRDQSGCISVPSSTGLCGQSTESVQLQFASNVTATSNSAVIQHSQAICSLSDVHSTNVLHSVYVFNNSDSSANKWNIEQRTNPSQSIQKPFSHMQFNPPLSSHTAPLHGRIRQQQENSRSQILQASLPSNQISSRHSEKEADITEHVQSLCHRQTAEDQNGGVPAQVDYKGPCHNKLNVKYEGVKSYGYNKGTVSLVNAEQVLSSKDEITGIPSLNIVEVSKSVACKENVSLTAAEYRTLEIPGIGKKIRQLKTADRMDSKHDNFGIGVSLTEKLNERQSRSKSVSKTETAIQTVSIRRNTSTSKQNVDTSNHIAIVHTKSNRICKSIPRSIKSVTRKTKPEKEVKSKSKKGMHRVNWSPCNLKSKLKTITKVSKGRLNVGHKSTLPKGPAHEKMLFLKKMLKSISHKYRVHLWLRSLYRANRLHPTHKPNLKCILCNKQLKRYSQWRLHSLYVHIQPNIASLSGQRSKLKEIKAEKKQQACGESLKCSECGSRYTLRKTLKFHLMQVHHMTLEQIEVNSELLIKCELNGCHFASIDFGELERHAKCEHPAIKYKCPHCQRPRTFYLLTMLDKHITKVHVNKPQFTCTHCGQQFVKYVYLQEHERDQHGIQHSFKLFRCDVDGCDYKSVRKVFLDKHKQLGHTEHKCPHCFMVVKTQDTLQTHIKTMHLNIRPFLCDVCGMGFAKEPVLHLHVKTKHNQAKEYKCQYCPYGTNVHWYLANHVFHRHGVKADFDNRKEISCPHCNVKYLTKSYLQKHIRNVHDQTFKCTCDVCGKSYKSYSAMSTHRKVHQEMEHKCPQCAYSSKTGEHMKLHIRTQHTFKGMKPYGCPYCTYCSAMGGNVRKHVMHKHADEEVRYNTNKEQILYMQITEAEMGRSSWNKETSGMKA